MTALLTIGTMLTGGLAGSLLTILTQSVSHSWRKPKLKILFDEKESGCRIETNFVGSSEIVQCYLRLKVKNDGRSTANEISLSVTKLTYEAGSGTVTTFDSEVMDLKVAMKADLQFRLAPGAHQYIDLFHTEKTFQTPLPRYDFSYLPARLDELKFSAGTYHAEVFASAKDASPAHRTVSWTFDGTFPGLHILGLK